MPILAVEPEVVNTAPIEEPAPEPKQEPTPLLDAHDEVLMSTPVMLAESTEICFTLPSLEGDQNAVEESIICSASDDVEEIVQTTELAEPVAEVVVVEESGPVPPTAIEELPAPEVTVVIEDKPEEVVDVRRTLYPLFGFI